MTLISVTKLTVMGASNLGDEQIDEVIFMLEHTDFQSLLRSQLPPEIAAHVTVEVSNE